MKQLVIADDEEFIRRLFQKILSDSEFDRIGVRVHLAANGQEVLNACAAGPIDLITMDISMPVMSGVQATREIRAHPDRYGTPIIIAVTGVGEKKEAIEAGCDDYLAKPVQNQELLDTVLSHLDPERRKGLEAEPKGQRVLLVDSDHGSLYWAQKALRSAGYSPMLAEDLGDAVRLCRYGTAPNLVIIDDVLLREPGSDGKQFLDELRRADIPLVLRGEDHAEGKWAAQARARLPRGAAPEALVERVSQILGG